MWGRMAKHCQVGQEVKLEKQVMVPAQVLNYPVKEEP